MSINYLERGFISDIPLAFPNGNIEFAERRNIAEIYSIIGIIISHLFIVKEREKLFDVDSRGTTFIPTKNRIFVL